MGNSQTTTTSKACTATCNQADLPTGAAGWNLYQWALTGEYKNSNEGELTAYTCDYLCIPSPKVPKCPVHCCRDLFCQTCQDCFQHSDAHLSLDRSFTVLYS